MDEQTARRQEALAAASPSSLLPSQAPPRAALGGERHKSAALHRFYVDEVKPLRFGPKEDASTTLVVSLATTAFVNAAFFSFCRVTDSAALWTAYLKSNQFIVCMLLTVWIVSFDIVSWIIYHYFERNDRYPADDFYIVAIAEDGGGGGGESALPSQEGANRAINSMDLPAVVEMPNDQIALIIVAPSGTRRYTGEGGDEDEASIPGSGGEDV